jgi:hypothetical protein
VFWRFERKKALIELFGRADFARRHAKSRKVDHRTGVRRIGTEHLA